MNVHKALADARALFKEKEYAKALERYEYFFDHALEEAKSLYGVRLSYCLDEWAELGSKYAPALARLRIKAEEAHELLLRTRNPERFHDYIAICGYLKRGAAPVELFLTLHPSDPELAKSMVRFIWDELVDAKQWNVCAAYLGDPGSNYALALKKFDRSMAISDENPSFGGTEFNEQIDGWYVRDVTNIVRVLANSGEAASARAILEGMESDMTARDRLDLVARIREQVLDGRA